MKLLNAGPPGSEQPGLLVGEDRWVPLTPFLARYGVSGGMNAVLGLLPMLITRAASALCGPHDAIMRPSDTRKLDYETELAVVIGTAASHVRPDAAMDHVAGFMAGDVLRTVVGGVGELRNPVEEAR